MGFLLVLYNCFSTIEFKLKMATVQQLEKLHYIQVFCDVLTHMLVSSRKMAQRQFNIDDSLESAVAAERLARAIEKTEQVRVIQSTSKQMQD